MIEIGKKKEVKVELPPYMIIDTENKPHTMIEIRPGELTAIMGHNTDPVLHGVVGIKSVDNTEESVVGCDMLFLSTDPECFRQIATAFNAAADHLATTMEDMQMEAEEAAEVTNE